MTFRVINHGRLDRAAWDLLIQRGSFFHTAAWVEICLEGLPAAHRAVFLCGFNGDKLVAGMPAVITRRYGFESFYSMPYGTYGAPVFSDGCSAECRREYLDYLAAYFRKAAFSKTAVADFEGRLNDLPGHELRRSRHFTHVVSLENPDEYRPQPNIESDLRTGRKHLSEISRISDISQIDDFYRLFGLGRIRHKGGPDPGRKFFEVIFRRLGKSDNLYWTELRAEGRMIGSSIHFIHGDTVFNWQTVSDYAMRQYKPGQMLMYDAIMMAVGKGLKKVNLGASPPEANGLVFYKERWLGVRTEYDVLTAHSWWRKLLRR